MKKSSLILAVVVLLASVAFGQTNKGSLTGIVSDKSGAAVADATATAKNLATSEEVKTVSTGQGVFNFPALAPGKYNVTVEAKGFKRVEVTGVSIDVSTPANLTFALEVGDVSEAVVVSGDTQEVVNTSSATLTNVITTRQVEDLPIAGRNPVELTRLQAGIAMSGTSFRTASVGGLRGSATNITQDGINAMDNFVKTDSFFALSAPSLNSTSEFSVTVGTVGSDSGRGVAQVRIVTPSGTNQLHGSAFWEHHNDWLNANTFFNNQNGTKRTIIRQNYFGFALSGPIFLPRFGEGGKSFFDLRNKGFWFFSYEGFREPFSVTRNRTVLTAAARTGLFSYTGSNGALQTVNLLNLGNFKTLNPITSAILNSYPTANNTLLGDGINTAGWQTNITGKDPNDKYNVRGDQTLIDNSRWGTHKLEIEYHRVNTIITPDTFNALEAPFPGGVNENQSSKRTLAAAAINSTFGTTITNEARFGHQRAPVGFIRETAPTSPFITFASVTNNDTQFLSQGRNTIVYQFLDNFTKVAGSHTFRAGTDVQSVTAITFNDAGINPVINLGTNAVNQDGITAALFPNLPSGATGNAIVTRARNIYFDLAGLLASASQTFNVSSPTSGFVNGATRARNFKQREISLYAQDQWKVKRNFTLNYGVRWEWEGVPYETQGLAIQPTTGVAGLYGISGFGNLFKPGTTPGQATTSLDFVNGTTGKKLYNNDNNNFAPFLGIAYSPNFDKGPLNWIFGKDGKSSIRAGYSISYLHDGFTVVSNALGTGTTNPGLIQAAANTTPTGVLTAVGVPITVPTFQIPITDAQNFAKNPNNGLWMFDPNLRVPYVNQWSFGIERELSNNTALEIRYVGNHAIKLNRAININEVNIFENGFLTDFLNAQKNLTINGGTSFAPGATGTVALPVFATLFAGLSNASGYTNSTFISNLLNNNVGAMANNLAFSTTYAANRANLKVNGVAAPNFFVANPNAAFARLLTNGSFSNYNSLQVELRRRFSKGVYFQANYTLSKSMTDGAEGGSQSTLEDYRTLRNISLDKHRSSLDQQHRFVANYIYELPFGSGKRFLANTWKPVERIIGGWQFGGIITLQSGSPISVFSGRSTFNAANPGLNPAQLNNISFADYSAKLGIQKLPNGVFFVDPSILTVTNSSTTGLVSSSSLNTGLLTAPAPGTFGNFPRAVLTGPSFKQVDFSLVKKTRITEKVRTDLRVTFLNAFNHANFVFGDQTFDSTSFGRITSTNGSPRNIFFNLGLSF